MNNTINIAVVGLGQVGIYLLNELNTKKKAITGQKYLKGMDMYKNENGEIVSVEEDRQIGRASCRERV